MATAAESSISRSDYVQNWKDQMKEAYRLVLQHSDDRKAKDISKNNTKRPCLTTLEPGDRVLIQNLSECGGNGKLRNYCYQQMHVVVLSVGENPVLYKVRPEHDSKKSTAMIYWTIIIGKSDKTANSPILNHHKDHLNKLTEARRKYLLYVKIVKLIVNCTMISM